MQEGCTLGISRLNIMAYADDIVLLAHSKSSMNKIYNSFVQQLKGHNLLINKNKTKCMIISKSKNLNREYITLANDNLQVVRSYKYLGHIITSNLNDADDVDLRLKSFYASFNTILRDFKGIGLNAFMCLFKSYCSPDYGLSLWHHNVQTSHIFKTFNVALNRSLKRIINVPTYSSSHEAAEVCDHLLLAHHVALIHARYYHRLIRSNIPIIKCNIHYLQQGYLIPSILNHFTDTYDIDITNTAIDIIKSRINWVQRHEPRREPYYFNHDR